MPTRTKHTAAESSDDEAPEAVSFGSSKKAAQGEREAVQQFHASEKQKRKEKNRAVDRALKGRSVKGKGKAKDTANEDGDSGSDEDAGEGGPSREDLEARMARAMMEADDEDLEEEGGESAFGGLSGEEDVEMAEDEVGMSDAEEESVDGDEDEGELEEDEDDEMDSGNVEDEEEVDLTAKQPTSSKRNYLPDHLFKSALSSAPSKSSKIVFDDSSRDSPPPSTHRKRKRRQQSSKDVILGSRTIRTLPKANIITSSVVAKGLSRPRQAEKFTRDSLNLKGNLLKSRAKGWARKSANLGVMKRSGPAANFVRNA
ncbi:hypothetical protein OH76DRAFT_532811 [Lentinus brumalis]|uniref:Uncharacterized protein n=1 Tax=Lentinus brumalis TaxID=2498619 RepID=A0A371DA90_9APHY|nr:hypothetical protein OH76DRAFT_532811 [Polyporus brumalis]